MSARRQVLLVGSGRMAAAFARSLRSARVRFSSLRARDASWVIAPRRGARRTVILAVTDAAIGASCEALVNAAVLARGDTIVHLAGMRGPEELAIARSVGAHVGAMHPLVAVASVDRAPKLQGFTASFEGDRPALVAARALGARLGLAVIALEGVDRARYHAAAALCATGGVALAQASSALLSHAARSLDPAVASRFASSLLASVAHNVGAVGAQAALASPLMRGDTAAVERHLASMAVHAPAAALYRAALSQVVASLDAQGSIDPAVIARAREILAAQH